MGSIVVVFMAIVAIFMGIYYIGSEYQIGAGFCAIALGIIILIALGAGKFDGGGSVCGAVFLRADMGGTRHAEPDGAERLVHRHAGHGKPDGDGYFGECGEYVGELCAGGLYAFGRRRRSMGHADSAVCRTCARTRDIGEEISTYSLPAGSPQATRSGVLL